MSNYSRLGINEYFLRIAELVSERSTCRRRKVGCILVDSLNHNKIPGKIIRTIHSPNG